MTLAYKLFYFSLFFIISGYGEVNA
ncbi:uncharacterized protein METZ01_LOCUS286768, partial [marine metagenome]